MKNILFAIFFAMLIAASCRTVKVLPSTNTEEKEKVEVIKELKVIDSLKVIRPSDTAKVAVSLENLTTKPITIRSKHTTLRLKKANGKIEAECVADEYKEIIELQKEIINTYREKEKTTKNHTVVQSSVIPEWMKPVLYVGFGVLLIIIVKKVNL